MRILVDADACPVKSIIERLAEEKGLDVIMFIDTSHELRSVYSKVVTVDKGIDAVDLKILKFLKSGDIVVTGDYGLASLALSKGGKAISQNGLIYSEDNIEQLLFERFLGSVNRKSGQRTKNIKKRTKENDDEFILSFESLFE